MPGLKEKYEKEIKTSLKDKFSYSSVMAVPKLEKIVLNMGLGQAVSDKNYLAKAVDELTLIAGQKCVPTKAKKSVSNFKLREGMNIGCKTTLRAERMYDFLERLVFIALPRVRDFQGISRKGFDGRGNYNLGVKEHIIFPEIRYDKIDSVKGLNITFVTTAKNNEEALAFLESLGLPFRKK